MGNPGGPGNPLAKANQLRAAISRAVTVADVREIAKKMMVTTISAPGCWNSSCLQADIEILHLSRAIFSIRAA